MRKNLQATIAFDPPSLGVKIAPATLALLRAMLERDPARRITSQAALKHEAFTLGLSRSPLITKPASNTEKLLRFKHITDQNPLGQKKTTGVVIPDRIEDLSPIPQSRSRYRPTGIEQLAGRG